MRRNEFQRQARTARPTPRLPEREQKPEKLKPKEGEPFAYPDFWTKGQLLNVCNAGSHYNITVLGEDFDTRYPERALQFPNSWECQAFVSWWYQPPQQRFG